MSNEPGRAFFRDGTVYWFEYQGSGGCACPLLFATRADQTAAWRAQDRKLNIELDLSGKSEGIILDTTYGGGLWWVGGAVRTDPQVVHLVNGEGKPVTVTVTGFITHRQVSCEPDPYNGWAWCDGLYRPWPGAKADKYEVTGGDDIDADLSGYDPEREDAVDPQVFGVEPPPRQEEFGAKIDPDDRRTWLAAAGRTFLS